MLTLWSVAQVDLNNKKWRPKILLEYPSKVSSYVILGCVPLSLFVCVQDAGIRVTHHHTSCPAFDLSSSLSLSLFLTPSLSDVKNCQTSNEFVNPHPLPLLPL